MSNIFRFRGVDGIFADVFRGVAYTLKVARDKEEVKIIWNSIRLSGHARSDIIGDVAIHFVDLAVALPERACQPDIGISIRADTVAKQSRRFNEHWPERSSFFHNRF